MFDYQSVLEIFFRMVPLSNIIFRQISGEENARILPFVGACVERHPFLEVFIYMTKTT
jgi:hypothetical protein